MPNYLFEHFEEVEKSIRRLAPPVIYKYRSDWNNVYHKKLITEQSAWFASPQELNDPYDIRTPIQFDIKEIENPIFFEKLKEAFKALSPNIAFTERDLRVICENKMEEIRDDPKSYFEKNYKDIREGNTFNTVGLFSCTSDGFNETMWAHYGNNHSGFAVGFNPVELARTFMCSLGRVKYSDEIPIHSFINIMPDADFDSFYLKSKKWVYEKEFRFITLAVEEEISRIKTYSINSVIEFLLGAKFPESQINEFVTKVGEIFPKDIPIYQVKPKISGFGLQKIKIN